MPRTRSRYPVEYRQQMVELVRAGRTPHELSKEFEPTAKTIREWVKQADRDDGLRHEGLTTVERDELARLRREVRRLRLEREILAKAAAWFARETGSVPPESSIREGQPGTLPRGHHVPSAGCLHQRILCVAQTTPFEAGLGRRCPGRTHPPDLSALAANLWRAAGACRTGR